MRFLFLVRAHHWVKNLFIFIASFFAGTLFHYPTLTILSQGFICFCLISSAVYILNDYLDIESDKRHPVKKNRPLASGKVSTHFALILMSLLAVASSIWSWTLGTPFFFAVLMYLFLNVAYSAGLKNIPLLDVFLVSLGFLIRTLSGGYLSGTYISQWLIIMIFLLSLLMAFAKREQDIILANGATVLRKSSRQYNLEFIHLCLALIAGIIMVAYIMYTMSDEVQHRIGENNLYLTSLFVFAGLLRYLQITLVQHNGGSPTRIFLTDTFIQVTIAGWVTTFFITLYWTR